MATLYKLVTQNYRTREGEYNETDWQRLQPPKTELLDPQMCSEDVYHACVHPDLAFLLNPIHANIENPRILKCSGEIVVYDYGKVGTFYLDVLGEIEKPEWVESDYESDVRIFFAFLCAKSVINLWDIKDGKDILDAAILSVAHYLDNKCNETALAVERFSKDVLNMTFKPTKTYSIFKFPYYYVAKAIQCLLGAVVNDYSTINDSSDFQEITADAVNYAATACDRVGKYFDVIALAEKAVEMAKEKFNQEKGDAS